MYTSFQTALIAVSVITFIANTSKCLLLLVKNAPCFLVATLSLSTISFICKHASAVKLFFCDTVDSLTWSQGLTCLAIPFEARKTLTSRHVFASKGLITVGIRMTQNWPTLNTLSRNYIKRVHCINDQAVEKDYQP